MKNTLFNCSVFFFFYLIAFAQQWYEILTKEDAPAKVVIEIENKAAIADSLGHKTTDWQELYDQATRLYKGHMAP